MRAPESVFVPRPWPQRPPENSPLLGRLVLILDSDESAARAVAEPLSRAGCSTQVCARAERLTELLRGTRWDLVIADPRAVGTEGLAEVRAHRARPTLFLLEDPEAEAVKGVDPTGAFARLAKPVAADELVVYAGRALEQRALLEENRQLRADLAGRFALGSVLTRDPEMRQILGTVETIADTRANVLLLGESGTGKTMLAHTIHQRSSRAERPFVVVSCGSLPQALLESELFGHARGAFTGAVKDKPGRFEQADGGTLFLDEINSAPLDLQVKLLRVLHDRSFERVGEGRTRTVDVRLISASNRDLEEEMAAGRFREDLYYRIHVVSLRLPPLRERPGDIALLAEHFVSRYGDEYGKAIERIAPDCLAALVAHRWPGNVRQLENAIERAVLVSTGRELATLDLGPDVRAAAADPASALPWWEEGPVLQTGIKNLPSLKEALEAPERRIIERALDLCGGNRKKTAELLGVNRGTLFNKMKKYGLMSRSFES